LKGFVHRGLPDFAIDVRGLDTVHATAFFLDLDVAIVRLETACRGVLHHRPATLAFGLREFLELVACPADGESLVVEEISDAPDHEHFMVLVVTPVAAALHGTQLRELLLPVTQHMRFDPAQFAYLTNGEVALGGNRWKRFLH